MTDETMTMKICNNCKHLTPTEEEQDEQEKKQPHFCMLYNVEVSHGAYHPKILAHDGCNLELPIKPVLKDIDDYVHPNEETKVVDIQQKRKDRKSEEDDKDNYSTKYDFEYNGKRYLLKIDTYLDGILCTYVFKEEKELPIIGNVAALRKYAETFFSLCLFDRLLNLFGAEITVESKLNESLPKFKDSTLKSLKVSKQLEERRIKLQKSLQ